MKTLLVLALEGVMDSSLTITLDTWRAARALAARGGKPDAVRILTVGAKKTVCTGGGLRLATDLTIKAAMDLADPPDWVVVPGLGLTSEAQIAARFAEKDAADAMRFLRAMAARGTRLGASCSAVFLLAAVGLLAGRQATMTWWLASIFRSRHPDVNLDEARMLVRDGPCLTAGSAFSQLDLALAVAAEAWGTEVAHLCSRYLLIDQRPSQARYMIQSHIRHVDPTVVAAERWIDGHLSEPISVTALSSALAVSPKTLARRVEAATGVSPVKFIQRRRLMHAAHLLETTPLSVDAVAARVGYQDGTALRKLVKREFGKTPGALRA